MAQARGIRIHQYLDDWLLRAPTPEICLQHTQTLLDLCRELGWVVNMTKFRVGAFAGLQFRRLPVRPDLRSGITHSGPLASPSREVEVHQEPSQVHRPSVHVPNRSFDGHGEAGLLRSTSHETFAMAPQEALACPRSFGKGDPSPSISPSSLGLVVGRKQCSERATPAPSSARRSTIYRRLKRRLWRTLRRLHCKRRLVSFGKSPSCKFSRDESSPSGLTTVRASVQGSDCSCGNGQYHSGLLHKQTGGYVVLGRVDGNSSYNSMGDNWGSHRFAQVKLKFLKTYIFSPSKADTSPKQ